MINPTNFPTRPDRTVVVVPAPPAMALPTATDRLMHVLAAAEQLVALCPATPTALDLTAHSSFPAGVMGVVLFIPNDASAVGEFARRMGVTAATSAHDYLPESLYVQAAGVLDDVPFLAWTSVPAASAVSPVVSLARRVAA